MSQTESPSNAQRRAFTRVPFKTHVVLNTFPDAHDCTLLDISLKGALMERPFPWNAAIGDPCGVSVELAGEDITINMSGVVAHVNGRRLGMACTEIDLDSMTTLRRLIELNLGSDETLDREIQAMVTAREAD